MARKYENDEASMIQGSIVALITPFLPSGEIDETSFRELIRWHIEQKTDGLVICGTTGESPTLSHEEKVRLFHMAVHEAKGRIPIIAGTGTNNTRTSVLLTEEAKQAGVDACLVVFPYYNRPTFQGCMAHIDLIAERGLPIILYNHPGRTGLKLTAVQLAEISHIQGVIGIKETSCDVGFAMELMRYTNKMVLSGDDGLTLPLMAAGAKGVISVVGNVIPSQWKEFVSTMQEGKYQEARGLYANYARLCKAMELETNPQGIKYAVSLIKRCEPLFRLPLLEPQASTKEEIAKALHGIIWEPKNQSSCLLQQVFQPG